MAAHTGRDVGKYASYVFKMHADDSRMLTASTVSEALMALQVVDEGSKAHDDLSGGSYARSCVRVRTAGPENFIVIPERLLEAFSGISLCCIYFSLRVACQ